MAVGPPVVVALPEQGLAFDCIAFSVGMDAEFAADEIREFLKSDAVTKEALAFAQKLDALWRQRLLVPASSSAPPEGGSEPPAVVPEPEPAHSAPRRARISPMKFAIPNAKMGQPYAASMTASVTAVGDAAGPVRFRNFKPSDLGVTLDEATGQLLGIPIKDGEHTLNFQWTTDGRDWASGSCVWLVNPDPRGLWKVLEPPADAPYSKTHTDGRTIEGPTFKITAGSRRGRSHEHGASFRDDDFHIDYDAASGWSVMIVGDGAGSARYSRRGSEIVCETGGKLLMAQLAGPTGARISAFLDQWEQEGSTQSVGVEFHHLFHEAAKTCVLALEAEAAARQAGFRDYSTTMLAAAVKRIGAETFVATFWMGDGAIGVYGPRGKVRLMGVPDGGEFAGQTRFLDRVAITDASFAKRLSVGRYADVTAVLLMTDGISDPTFETENALGEASVWDSLWDAIEPCLAAAQPHAQLVEWMGFFSPGHHDDRTLVVLW